MAVTETVQSVAMIPLKKIVVVEGHNPRHEFDKDDLSGLTASIKQFGVLQPLLVKPENADGMHELVAGERRFRASTSAGLAAVPALIRESDADASEVALIENLERVNLNPIEEAGAYQAIIASTKISRKDLAGKVNKAPSVITEALALLELPDNVQKRIADGELPPAAARYLRKIAKVSVPAAAHAAEIIASDSEIDATHPERDAWALFAALEERVGKKIDGLPVLDCCADDVQSLTRPESAIVWPEGKEGLAAQLKEHAFGYSNAQRFQREIFEAGKTFGCVFEINDYSGVVLNAEFVVSQVEEFIKRSEQANADRAKAAGADPAKAADPEAQKEVERAAKAKEREKKTNARLDAIEFNGQLGVNMAKKLGKTKVNTEFMKMLAGVILTNNRDLAGAGLALCDPAMRKVEVLTRKNGASHTKAEFAEPSAAHEQLIARIAEAKTPEEVAAHLLGALIAGRYVKSNATVQSDYRYWHSSSVSTKTLNTGATIEKLALPVLPTSEAQKVRERNATSTRAAAAKRPAAKKPAPRKSVAKKPAAAKAPAAKKEGAAK